MCWLIAIFILVLLCFLIWASSDIGSNIYLKTLCHGQAGEKTVALTFDDGPNPHMTPLVLDVLKEYGIKATFFLVGTEVQKNQDIVRRMISEGHIVGNHTHSHKSVFPLSGAAAVQKELRMCNAAIAEVIGKKPKLFRPPFGVTNPIIGKEVMSLQMKAVGWSIRSFDTISSINRGKVCERVVKNLRPGAIILLHDRCDNADKLLKNIIQSIINQGYTFTTIDKILKENPYAN